MHSEFIEGLGDRLVSGESAATEILVGRDSGVTRPADAEKAAMIESLYLSGLAIEKLFGRPMDCEWAYNKTEKQLYLLQARPVTATEHEEAIVEEQTAHVATVPATADFAAPRWKRSDVREVVDNPSGLAVSMLQETYSKDGAIGIAGERLGVHFDDTPMIRLFGQLYEPMATVSLGAVRTQLGMWRLKRRVASSGDEQVRRLKEECAKAPPKVELDATDARGLAKQIVDLFGVFVRDVYPTAFEATLLAKLATPATDIPKVHTISADMFSDLVKLAGTGDPKPFVARWGHRSQSDYDLAVPSFGDDVEALVAYAGSFKGMSFANDDGDHGETSVYGELVKLKEVAKDRAVKFLRQGRAPLLRLADLLKIDREKIFMLPLSSLRAVADGSRAAKEIAAEIEAIAKREEAWKSVSLPDEVSPADIEFLRGEVVATEGDGASLTGKFVATNKEFSGEVVHAASLDDNQDLSGAVLVVEALQPTVVKYFGRVTAIVSQTGAYLSHAAIVAREAGVPVVVLPKALSLLPHAGRIKVSSEGSVSVQR
jgi:phosphohistidine swiveling domain-containing protein